MINKQLSFSSCLLLSHMVSESSILLKRTLFFIIIIIMPTVATCTSKHTSINPFIVSIEPLFANRNLVVTNVATQALFPGKSNFDALLIGYDLYRFIDDTLPCPSPILSNSASSSNLDYTF